MMDEAVTASEPGVADPSNPDVVRYEFTFQPTSTTSVACPTCCGLALRRVGTSPEMPGKMLMIVTCGHCGQAQ